MACNLNNVLKGANECKENPAGLSNYCMIVPFNRAIAQDGAITSVAIKTDDGKEINQYDIETNGNALKGFKVEFKNQTGQVTSEDNGSGKGWTGTGTGRVEIGEDAMATLSRTLSNLDGNFMAFFPTGNKVIVGNNQVTEWKVVGNEAGDCQFSTAADSGAARSDDHGTTFTVTCDYMKYDVVKYVGEITMIEE